MVKFLRGFKYAFQGIWYAFRTQINMRVHLGLSVILIITALIFGISTLEWAILLAMMGLVFSLEILNTAIEATVNLITKEFDPLAKIAKDAAAGAVLMAAIFAVGVALFIFVPRFLGLFSK
jgi:diacylglycerol kinase